MSAFVLLLGLGIAVITYLSVSNGSESALSLESENFTAYFHDLEQFGRNANILSDEFMLCLSGFLHGKLLAYTIGYIAVQISSGLFIIGYVLPSNQASDVPEDNNKLNTD